MNLSSDNIIKSSIPKKIHNYELQNEICEIPCGYLYVGLNNYINEKVYIKIYDKLLMFTSFNITSLINNEIHILKLLNHKNILQLYEYIESDSYIFIIFEYFNGESLQQYITKKKKLNDNIYLKIFYDIVNVMDYIHSMNICHLNINFENILIDENNNIKIINFENACFYKDNIKKEMKDNTNYLFTCPEFLSNQSFSPEKADVYSCGILLYYLTQGNLPFQSDNKVSNVEMITKGKYILPFNIKKSKKDLIHNMLENKPDKRFTFKDILNCDWFKENKNILDKMPVNQGINIIEQKYPIDNNILKICDEYELNNTEIKNDVENNNFTANNSIYKQLAVNLNEKNIPTDYINNEDNYYTNENQKNEYMKKEKEKNNKMKELEKNFYSNGFSIYEELAKLKKQLKEQKYTINFNDMRRSCNYHDLNQRLSLRNQGLKNNEKAKKQRTATKKVTIKKNQNNPPSPTIKQRSRKSSMRTKKQKETNPNANANANIRKRRQRFFTIELERFNQEEKYKKKFNGNEDINKDSFLDKARNRGKSLHAKFNKNKLINLNKTKKQKKKLNEINKIKDGYEIPFRKRIYSTVNKKKNVTFNVDKKNINNNDNNNNNDNKDNNNNDDATLNKNKDEENNNDEDEYFPIQRKRVYTLYTKIEKNKNDKENLNLNLRFSELIRKINDEQKKRIEKEKEKESEKPPIKTEFEEEKERKFSKYKTLKIKVEELTI